MKDGMSNSNPFFYVIHHTCSGKMYAGYCSSKKRCNSDSFMKADGYQTSSKDVRDIIKNDGLSLFVILRIRHFHTQAEAIKHEALFLSKVNAKHNPKFYNMSNGHKQFFLSAEANERRRLKSIGRKHSQETIEKMKLRRHTKEHCDKISKALKGRPKTPGFINKMKGRSFSAEHQDKLKAAWKTRVLSESELLNRAKARIGCKWWNDGSTNKFCKDSPGNNWVAGMMFKARSR